MPFGMMPRMGGRFPQDDFNPSLPYERNLPHDGFVAPYWLRLVAVPATQWNRFEVNFMLEGGEHALHFNPRCKEQCAVRNTTKEGGKWCAEERESSCQFNFQEGVPFVLDFKPAGNRVDVFLDGDFFCSFTLRDDFTRVRSLQIGGDLSKVVLVSLMKDPQP